MVVTIYNESLEKKIQMDVKIKKCMKIRLLPIKAIIFYIEYINAFSTKIF